MKIKTLSICSALILTFITFYACSDDAETNESVIFNNLNYKLSKKSNGLRLQTSDSISPIFAKLGISKLNIKEDGDIYFITYEKKNNGFGLSKNFVDITTFKFVYDATLGKLNIVHNTDYSLVRNGIDNYLETPSGKLEYFDPINENFNLNTEASILMMVYQDLSTSYKDLLTLDNYIKNHGNTSSGPVGIHPAPCSFWDEYTVVTVGFTRQSTENHHYNATHGAGALGAGCRRLTDPETSCIGDNHCCITTSSFCCE